MNNYKDIIIAPIITEKSGILEEKNNQFVFEVSRTANKVNIKQAIESLFEVEVEKVNIINEFPSRVRVGKYEGRKNRKKKAIVTLKKGSSIKFE